VAQNLTYADEEDEEEDDLLDDQLTAANCPKCGDDIRLTEEVFHITFVRAYQGASNIDIKELRPDGQPIGVPFVFCFECWEQQKEELQDSCEDELPIEDVHDAGLLECDICHSDICEGETLALETFGEIHWSTRSPSGSPTMVFQRMGDSCHICIECITQVEEDNQFQLEVHDYDGQDTCAVGRHLRCWRDRSRCVHCPKNKE
jgi:hypothetical protein